jgi:SNF2 family DNA or RNA helicase
MKVAELEELVAYMLKPIMLRRTKKNLPELFSKINLKEVEVKVEMSEKQRIEYDSIETRLTSEYKKLEERGELKKNMMHIFAIISKLRQICDHK